jgi:hypothetical protein
MRKYKTGYFIFCLLCIFTWSDAQDLSFKLSSKVELRNWNLTNKAMKNANPVDKATIELHQASGIVSQSSSDAEGNFELTIPAAGEFTLVLNSPGQNPKKFLVSTKGISPGKNDANFRPSVNIMGLISVKHKKDMNYLGLDKTNVSIVSSQKNIYPGTTISDGEYLLIQKFCTANKLGDMALEKKNYTLAKTFYEMATDMIEGEPYPKEQLKKAEQGMKLEKLASRKKTRSKQDKVKSAITNQNTTTKSGKTTNKNSVETGKPVRKTPKPL